MHWYGVGIIYYTDRLSSICLASSNNFSFNDLLCTWQKAHLMIFLTNISKSSRLS